MRNLNSCNFSGHLGKDPETVPAGATTVTKFSLAVNDEYKDAAGNKQQRTNWVQIAVFNANGENVAQFLRKGSHIIVECAVRSSEWDDKETGQKRFGTEFVASKIHFLDKKADAPATKRPRRKPGPQPVE